MPPLASFCCCCRRAHTKTHTYFCLFRTWRPCHRSWFVSASCLCSASLRRLESPTTVAALTYTPPPTMLSCPVRLSIIIHPPARRTPVTMVMREIPHPSLRVTGGKRRGTMFWTHECVCVGGWDTFERVYLCVYVCVCVRVCVCGHVCVWVS